MTNDSNLHRYILYIDYNGKRYYGEGGLGFSKNILDAKLFRTVAAIKASIKHFPMNGENTYYLYAIDSKYHFTHDMFKIGRVSNIVMEECSP